MSAASMCVSVTVSLGVKGTNDQLLVLLDAPTTLVEYVYKINKRPQTSSIVHTIIDVGDSPPI
jgi:hypothetical protein